MVAVSWCSSAALAFPLPDLLCRVPYRHFAEPEQKSGEKVAQEQLPLAASFIFGVDCLSSRLDSHSVTLGFETLSLSVSLLFGPR